MNQNQDAQTCPKCQKAIPGRASLCQHCGHNMAKSSQTSHVGKLLGNLQLLRIIGEGGMGAVYQAEHTSLGTHYAVKVLYKAMSRDHIFAERFRREAVACSTLRHPNIVFVTDFGKHPEMGLYLVMEYLKGEDLCGLIQRQRRLEIWQAVDIISQVCDALEVAHSASIVHRDLKLENIFLTTDTKGDTLVKLLDFGVARVTSGEEVRLTQQGIAVGTPYYMSPEQAVGQSDRITAASDLYALGAILYEIIVGGPIFVADSPFEIMSMHLRQPPTPVSRWRPELKGTQLETLILDMLAKAPEDRPVSAAAVRQALAEAQRELQELNIEDAFEPALDGGQGLAPPMRNARLSGLVAQLTPPPEGPRLSSALGHLAHLPNLDEELLFWMSWGVLTRDLLDAEPGSDRMKQATHGAALFIEHICETAEPGQTTLVRDRLGQGLQELLQLADKGHRNTLVAMIQPLMSHPLFPADQLPSWAMPNINGSWSSFKSLLNTSVTDLLRGRGHGTGSRPGPEHDIPAPTLPAEPETLSNEEEPSLSEKLSQDMSLDNLRSVLGHEIRLFKKKPD